MVAVSYGMNQSTSRGPPAALKDRESGLMTPNEGPGISCNEPDTEAKSESSYQGQRAKTTQAKQGPQANILAQYPQGHEANIERLRDAVYIRYLFEDFVLSPSRDTESGWLALLIPKLYAEAAVDTTLSLAVRAAAFAYMGNKREAPELRIEAKEMYGRCLKTLALDLTNREIATSTSTSVAVLVLGLYEVYTSII